MERSGLHDFLNNDEEASNGKIKFEGIAEFVITLIEKYSRPRMNLIALSWQLMGRIILLQKISKG